MATVSLYFAVQGSPKYIESVSNCLDAQMKSIFEAIEPGLILVCKELSEKFPDFSADYDGFDPMLVMTDSYKDKADFFYNIEINTNYVGKKSYQLDTGRGVYFPSPQEIRWEEEGKPKGDVIEPLFEVDWDSFFNPIFKESEVLKGRRLNVRFEGYNHNLFESWGGDGDPECFEEVTIGEVAIA